MTLSLTTGTDLVNFYVIIVAETYQRAKLTKNNTVNCYKPEINREQKTAVTRRSVGQDKMWAFVRAAAEDIERILS